MGTGEGGGGLGATWGSLWVTQGRSVFSHPQTKALLFLIFLQLAVIYKT